MKHKIGDKVRIKSLDWYNENKNTQGEIELSYIDDVIASECFIPSMSKYCGKVATIVFVDKRKFYNIDIDDKQWLWNDDMFEKDYKQNNMENKEVKIALPKNCEAKEIKTSVKDNFIVVNYITQIQQDIQKKFVPKDGDIYFDNQNECPQGCISIFNKEVDDFICDYCCYNIDENSTRSAGAFSFKSEIKEIRSATDEEKKLLFDKLKEAGYQWNAEAKKVEKYKWTPDLDGTYHYIYDAGVECSRYDDDEIDKQRISLGNCFQTKKDAQEYLDRIAKLLRNR